MSYTIHQQPLPFMPAYNDHIYVVSSSFRLQPNYKYIAVVNVASQVITVKQSPHPSYGSTFFNVGRIIENAVTHDIDKASVGFSKNDNSGALYNVDFYEEYDVAGVLTVSSLMVAGDNIQIFNGVIDFLRFQNYNQDYMLDSGSILNHSLSRDIQIDQDAWFYYVVNDVTAGLYAVIETFDATGSLLQVCVVVNPYQVVGDSFVRFGCGPRNLNDISILDISAGTQPFISSDVASYTVRFSDSPDESGSFDTQDFLFNVVDSDCVYETFRIHYLNELGAFESFNFTKASKHTSDTKKENYKPVVGGLLSSTSYGYSKSDASTKTYYTTTKDKYKVRTNWLSEAYQNVLEQLITSPVTYWDKPGDGLVAIDITTSNFEFQKKVTTKMMSLEIDFELSFDRYRQRY